jgi:hypothetical protein
MDIELVKIQNLGNHVNQKIGELEAIIHSFPDSYHKDQAEAQVHNLTSSLAKAYTEAVGSLLPQEEEELA